jgi:hypothetical protein
MQPSNDFRVPLDYYGQADIGGPMWVSNEYRWNVPVVTYGFDPSFLDFFGTNGVAAVEGAIQMLNNVPPASSIILNDYTNNSVVANNDAEAQSLYDLRSVTLSLLLEQLGLASPTTSIYVLKNFIIQGDTNAQYSFVARNYDPSTLVASDYINGYLYYWTIWSPYFEGENEAAAVPYEADTLADDGPFTAVADKMLDLGELYSGLSSDDGAGLRYLYSSNNVNYEMLLSSVSGAGTNANSWVNGAWRPGVEKVTFIPHPVSSQSGRFLATTNQYTDTYFTNGEFVRQQVQRVIARPDFLFCAGDTGREYPLILPYARTATSNWINNAALNGSCSNAGPGVIPPPVTITFDKLGSDSSIEGTNFFSEDSSWGTFDQSTNVPVVYPIPQSGSSRLLLRLWFSRIYLFPIPFGQSVEFSLTSQPGKSFVLQTSTNLTQWVSLQTNANNGSIWTVFERPLVSQRYYRLIPSQ